MKDHIALVYSFAVTIGIVLYIILMKFENKIKQEEQLRLRLESLEKDRIAMEETWRLLFLELREHICTAKEIRLKEYEEQLIRTKEALEERLRKVLDILIKMEAHENELCKMTSEKDGG